MQDPDTRYVDSSNIDELLYEIGFQEVDKPWYWKKHMDLKLWWKHRKESKRLTQLQNFLHYDLRDLRYIGKSGKTCARLRYFDKEGRLKSRMFFVQYGRGGLYLTEFKYGFPIDSKPTKGPLTIKVGELVKVRYGLFGLMRRKTFLISYYSCI